MIPLFRVVKDPPTAWLFFSTFVGPWLANPNEKLGVGTH